MAKISIIKDREKIIDIVRAFFKVRGFVEVETPLLVSAPDPSPYNEVFETSKVRGKRAFLTPSPEFFMKRLLAQGANNIFQICKAFRNPQELNPFHNPEFTILEWYRVNATYTDLMVDCENLVSHIFKSLSKQIKSEKLKNSMSYLGKKIDITLPWPRISVKEAFNKYANVDLDEFMDLKTAKRIAQNKSYKVEKETTWEQLYHQIFLNEIEPNFPKDKPLILFDYPAPLAALSQIKKTDPRYAERFEFYIGGVELGNGYSELTDSKEQKKRLIGDLKERKKLCMKTFPYDRKFVEALKSIPKTAGIAVGIDRLIMLFTNSATIQEVLPFPANDIFTP